jgi:heptosyltransferase-2
MSALPTTDGPIAVVKPDHLGDFVLSLPALRALQRRFGTFDLHLSPSNRFLYDRYLPSSIGYRPITLEYLSRGKGGLGFSEFAARMSSYRMVVLLRSDLASPVLRRVLGERLVTTQELSGVHETALERQAILPLTGDYSRQEMMWGSTPPRWPERIRTVAISLGAGFTSNKFPLVCWIDLAQRLRRDHGIEVKLTGGPLERGELALAAKRLKLGDESVFVGSTDLDTYEAQLASCDVVIGADSGSLHLASMTRPVVGVFTSSSWRRFAPMGSHVRVLFADLVCSPCIQYSPLSYNACVWRECAAVISTADLVHALLLPTDAGTMHLSPNVALAFAPYALSSDLRDAVSTLIPEVISRRQQTQSAKTLVGVGGSPRQASEWSRSDALDRSFDPRGSRSQRGESRESWADDLASST